MPTHNGFNVVLRSYTEWTGESQGNRNTRHTILYKRGEQEIQLAKGDIIEFRLFDSMARLQSEIHKGIVYCFCWSAWGDDPNDDADPQAIVVKVDDIYNCIKFPGYPQGRRVVGEWHI